MLGDGQTQSELKHNDNNAEVSVQAEGTNNDNYEPQCKVRCVENIVDIKDKEIKDNDTTSNEPLENIARHQTEADVGITTFISKHQGFKGIFKHRYSDFLVNEIDKEGNILHLTDIQAPTKLEADTEDNEVAPSIDKFLNSQKKMLLQTMLNSEQKLGSVSINVDYREKNRWPKNRGRYCHFILYKENSDTIEAVGRIIQMLNIRNDMLTYAGTKDKRAKTCQKISVFNVGATRLFHLNKALRYMTIGNFSYNEAPLKLGDLKGNHFTIIIRSVTGSKTQIDDGMNSLIEYGFINYFGMQRFGTTIIPTHEIGKALLKSNWSKAIDLILTPRGENTGEEQARITWTCTKDANDAFHQLGSHSSIEKQLLYGLKEHNDLVGALSKLPRKVRHLYLHSYQSRIWNRVASKRIEMYGLKPVVGDLVLDGVCQGGFDKVKVLQEGDLGEFTIYDIVLTIPGHAVIYPDNDIDQVYKDLLMDDDFTLKANETFKHKILDYSLSGGYRKILVKPTNVNYSIIKYDDATISLIDSDLDLLKCINIPEVATVGHFTALKLEFSLPSSCYATMAIREVLKCDTTILTQSKLTKEANQ